nr:MAG TPA: hypothetical protein [Caudoviricetes sp.]
MAYFLYLHSIRTGQLSQWLFILFCSINLQIILERGRLVCRIQQ